MPIKGPLRAVDTKVLGIDLAQTPVHGSALERHVFVSVDAGHGHPDGLLDFIAREAGVVVRESAADPAAKDPAHWTALATARRSLDVIIVSAGAIERDTPAADIAGRTADALQAISTAIEALRPAGGRVVLSFDVPVSA